MPRPDEGLIHAWLDGELDAAEAARVQQLVETDAEWGAAAAEARGLIAASSRILGQLDVVAGDVIPKATPTAPAAPAPQGDASVRDLGAERVARDERRVRRAVPAWLRVAAGFLLVAGVGYLGFSGRGTVTSVAAPEALEGVSLSREAPKVAAESQGSTGAAAANAPAANTAPTRAPSEQPRALRAESEVTAQAPAPPAPSPRGAEAPALRDAAPGDTRAVADVAASQRAGDDSAARTQRERSIEEAAKRFAAAGGQLSQVVVTGATSGAGSADRPAQERRAVEAPARTLAQPQAAKAAAAPAAPVAALAAPAAAAELRRDTIVPVEILEGCWRISTPIRGQIDSLIRDPRILQRDADSLRIETRPGTRPVWIRFTRGGAFAGSFGRVATFEGRPIDCS